MPNISCYNVICTENNGAFGLQAIFEIIEVMIGKSPNKYFLSDSFHVHELANIAQDSSAFLNREVFSQNVEHIGNALCRYRALDEAFPASGKYGDRCLEKRFSSLDYIQKDIGVNPYTHFRNAPHAILPILFFRPLLV